MRSNFSSSDSDSCILPESAIIFYIIEDMLNLFRDLHDEDGVIVDIVEEGATGEDLSGYLI